MNQSKQVSALTRPCLACEGRGWTLGQEKPSKMWPQGKTWEATCPVCLGSGRVDAKPEGFASAEARKAWLKGANGCSDHGISGFAKESTK